MPSHPLAHPAALALQAALRGAGRPLTAAELVTQLGVSQPTLSRLLRGMSHEVLVLGQGRATRYAWPQSIAGLPARQPLHWIDEAGRITPWGEVAWLAGDVLHVQGPGVDWEGRDWPWFLAPLRPQGFLGRLLARRLAAHGLDADPQRWSLAQALFAALRLVDPPGALVLGPPALPGTDPSPVLATPADADACASDVAATLPAGSSAGGEQAKFLARLQGDSMPVLVKFTPPRGTPFGERWHDLLVAEHTALALLAEHGVAVAHSRLWHSAQRSYLLSTRFDRVAQPNGQIGRRHVVALDAWHAAFVPGTRQHWAATCEALARQRRVPADLPAQAAALLHFGRLIGNTDMHFGNLSLWVQPDDVAAGRGTLAPVYDMLPMRWRPDAQAGTLDLTPFTPETIDAQSSAAPLARTYWDELAADTRLSEGFRMLARAMLDRLA